MIDFPLNILYHSLYINVTTGEIAAHAQELFKAVEMGSAKQGTFEELKSYLLANDDE